MQGCLVLAWELASHHSCHHAASMAQKAVQAGAPVATVPAGTPACMLPQCRALPQHPGMALPQVEAAETGALAASPGTPSIMGNPHLPNPPVQSNPSRVPLQSTKAALPTPPSSAWPPQLSLTLAWSLLLPPPRFQISAVSPHPVSPPGGSLRRGTTPHGLLSSAPGPGTHSSAYVPQPSLSAEG